MTRKFEENFKIPRPPPGDDSDSEKEEEPEPEGPACGTRSGQRKKKKAEEDAEVARRVKQKTEFNDLLHIDTDRQAKEDSRSRMTVQKRLVYSVAVYSAMQLFRFQDRLKQAADLYGTRKTPRTTLPWNKGYVKHKQVLPPKLRIAIRERDCNTFTLS